MSATSDLPIGIEIRAEAPDDRAAIADVVAAAFGSQAEARLVDAIRASPQFIPELSLVAVVEERIVGHVMISHAEIDDAGARQRIATLSPLAVAPPFQRHGIGSALVQAVTARADASGEPLVVLEGSPAYYGARGFEHSVKYGIRITLPEWAPPEAAQVMRLANYSASIRGQVVYPPAFDVVTDHPNVEIKRLGRDDDKALAQLARKYRSVDVPDETDFLASPSAVAFAAVGDDAATIGWAWGSSTGPASTCEVPS